jgi:protein TonB
VVADRKPGHALHYAVLASLALHAAALLAVPELIDSARRVVSFPPPLVARLLEPEPQAVPVPAPPPAPVNPAPNVSAAPVEKKKPPPRIAKPVPEITSRAAPAAPPAPPAAEPPVPAATPAPAPAPVAPPVAAVKPQPSPPSAEPPESLSRDQYRLQLIGEARRHKRYPPLARENNWQGDVLVAVTVRANGRASLSLKESSGYEVLDRQALEMFAQAARAVAVPPALRGKEFALEVRAVYGLED